MHLAQGASWRILPWHNPSSRRTLRSGREVHRYSGDMLSHITQETFWPISNGADLLWDLPPSCLHPREHIPCFALQQLSWGQSCGQNSWHGWTGNPHPSMPLFVVPVPGNVPGRLPQTLSCFAVGGTRLCQPGRPESSALPLPGVDGAAVCRAHWEMLPEMRPCPCAGDREGTQKGWIPTLCWVPASKGHQEEQASSTNLSLKPEALKAAGKAPH